MKTLKSEKLFRQALQVIPGGVNSPVRAFKSVALTPPFIKKAKGAYVWDVDGNKYIDYVCSWGPLILGHAHPRIVRAVQQTAKGGTSFGAPTELEVKMAGLICKLMPSIEMVRMVNSGTEATMSAIRLARAYTGREKIIKFEGCYHGHADSFLIKAGSGAMTFGVPDSPGVPQALASETLVARFNDLGSVNDLVKHNDAQIAAIIVEPIAGNMGCIPPKPGFLAGLRKLCTEHNIVLIFDEVITGFRVSIGGAQELYNIKPDLTTLGKIIGGGLPVGAYGGKREIMELIAPSGPVYQAGTLSGNPIAMAAGCEMLSILSKHRSVYKTLEKHSQHLEEGIRDTLGRIGKNFQLNHVGSMYTLFFTEQVVLDYETAKQSDASLFSKYFSKMLELGIYLPPSQFETAFLSTVHSQADLDKTLHALHIALMASVSF
ncbi:MAG: glutamate-1-semialdehyde 2,1-aminomutase [Ignavibacteriae bacterium]|nr:glutamate-1-semialdehyde 2,1-aminomutase [Ignavibacteriota bacterium]